MYQFLNPPPPVDTCDADPVGVIEIADRLNVEARSVHMALRRERLPAPDHDSINGARAWEWRNIMWWAGETGRLRTPKLVSEYVDLFDAAPPFPDRVGRPPARPIPPANAKPARTKKAKSNQVRVPSPVR